MSDETAFVVRVEPQRIDGRFAALLGVVAIVIILLCGVWVNADLPPRGVIDAGVEGRAPLQLHGVLLTLINADQSTERFNDAQRRRLRTYEWVDKKEGIVRIPIDEAMTLVEKGR